MQLGSVRVMMSFERTYLLVHERSDCAPPVPFETISQDIDIAADLADHSLNTRRVLRIPSHRQPQARDLTSLGFWTISLRFLGWERLLAISMLHSRGGII